MTVARVGTAPKTLLTRGFEPKRSEIAIETRPKTEVRPVEVVRETVPVAAGKGPTAGFKPFGFSSKQITKMWTSPTTRIIGGFGIAAVIAGGVIAFLSSEKGQQTLTKGNEWMKYAVIGVAIICIALIVLSVYWRD